LILQPLSVFCSLFVCGAMARELVYNNDVNAVAAGRVIWKSTRMNKVTKQSIGDVAQQTPYPPEAFEFVREGLALTVQRLHRDADELPEGQRHVSGQDLARGLRDLAISNYGVLAAVVLAHWNIHTTMDFGKIVFAMVESGIMHKTPEDNVEDFRDVYDFDEAFTAPQRPIVNGTTVFDLTSH
jgi:uncharacterized repeat protein (TIGR04138 family)